MASNRKSEDYDKARRGVHNPVQDDGVHEQADRDRQAIRGGKHTELANDAGTGHQEKGPKGYRR